MNDSMWSGTGTTGPFLLDLWRQGLEPTPERLATRLELGLLQIDPLIRSVTRRLN